ncbi:MAG: hypothetical protein IJP90_16810, partial [Treponema sp.]|nr:hypothetical protein [Treponema sp.]
MLLVFIVLLAASFVVIGKGARINFENQSHKELMQLRKNMKLEFELGFKEQIALAVQMAKSPLIVKYFENPSDDDLKDSAFAEVAAYQDSFLSKLSFMINDTDLKYYANNEYLYTLDTEDPTSAWYLATKESDKAYEFNVDYDIGLKQTFMWVNCIVRNQNGGYLGLIGTGIPISEFVNSLYSDLPKEYSMYIYNKSLETTGSPELSHLENKTPITTVIPELEDVEEELAEIGEAFIDDAHTVYSFEPLEEIGWNIMVAKSYSPHAFIEGAIV